jgi:Arc/MetJ-type ribon-helix-helix transcriptional regulator
MNLNELPRDLEQFVYQEIVQGKYQSAAEVVSVALCLLREHEAQSGNGQTSANGYPHALPGSAEKIVEALTNALASGHHALARQLAMDGAHQYPDHDELQKYGRILAPPTGGRPIPTTPESRAALKANNVWLKAHWQEYRGNWIALQAGHLLHASPSVDDVVEHVGTVRGRDIFLTKIN